MQKDAAAARSRGVPAQAAEPVSWREIQEQFPEDYGGQRRGRHPQVRAGQGRAARARHPGPLRGGRRGPARRLPHRQRRVLPPRPEAAARGPGAPLPRGLGGAGQAGLPLRPRPRPRAEQALLRGARPGRLGGGGARGAAPLREDQDDGRDADAVARARGALPRGRAQEAGPPRLRGARSGASAPSATSIRTGSSRRAAPGTSPAGATCARTSGPSTSARIETLAVNGTAPRTPDFAARKDFPLADYATRETWEYAVHAPLRCRVRLDAPVPPEVRRLLRAARAGDEEGAAGAWSRWTRPTARGSLRHVLVARRPRRAALAEAAAGPGARAMLAALAEGLA